MAHHLEAAPSDGGTSGRGHVLALDGVRGAAVLAVMVYHCTVLKPVAGYEHWFCAAADLGRFGVDLFFVLSGFLITTVLQNSRRERFFRNFYIRRSLRIFPLYYALIAAAFVAAPLVLRFAAHSGVHGGRSGESLLWYVTYCSNFLVALRNAWPHGFLDVSWSLCIEEHFYIVWPVLVFFLRKRALRLVLVSTLVLSIGLRAVMLRSGVSPLQIYVLTFTRLDGLALGSLLSLSMPLLAAHSSQLRKIAWGGFCASAAVVGALFLWGHTRFDSPVISIFGYTLVSGMFALLLTTILLSPETSTIAVLFEQRWLRTLGRYSYALYLMHLPVRSAIRDAIPFGDAQFRRLHEFALMGQLAFYLVSGAATLLLAWLSWNVLEKRFLALKDRFAPATHATVASATRVTPIHPDAGEALP